MTGLVIRPSWNSLMRVMPSIFLRGISTAISRVAYPWQRFLTAFGMTLVKFMSSCAAARNTCTHCVQCGVSLTGIETPRRQAARGDTVGQLGN